MAKCGEQPVLCCGWSAVLGSVPTECAVQEAVLRSDQGVFKE